jgi:hypothetical protein
MKKEAIRNRAALTRTLLHQGGPSAAAERLPKPIVTRDDINMMRSRTLVFAFFAAAMLFSVVREWSVPAGCPRLTMIAKSRHR